VGARYSCLKRSSPSAEFARECGCAELGRLAGLWHDLGKRKFFFDRPNDVNKNMGGKHGDHSATDY